MQDPLTIRLPADLSRALKAASRRMQRTGSENCASCAARIPGRVPRFQDTPGRPGAKPHRLPGIGHTRPGREAPGLHDRVAPSWPVS